MKPSEQTYDQPEKHRARQLALSRAVEALTSNRESSPVITIDHFRRGIQYVGDTLEHTNSLGLTRFDAPHDQLASNATSFEDLHASRVGTRSVAELQVLYLCGPEPMNDFEVMLELGIRPENVWAVESDKASVKLAIKSLTISGYGIKLYRGKLDHFFEIVPQRFDLIYYDACAALTQKDTLRNLRRIFEGQRLASLACLITNFAGADMDGDAGENLAKRLGSWFFGRDEWEDFETDYWTYVKERSDEYYSRFVSQLPIELGGLLMPWWRVAALNGARQEYYSEDFANKVDLKPFHEERSKLERSPDAYFEDSFSEYQRISRTAMRVLRSSDPLRILIANKDGGGVSLADAVSLAHALRNCSDYEFAPTLDLNRRLCSPLAVEVLTQFKWIDQELRIFCDIPLPNLLADLLLGLYGFPYHANVVAHRRWQYVASGKRNRMHLDVFVFDQARYFYDLVPSLPFVRDRLRFREQWVLRVCMDGIFRHTHDICREWFYASTLAEMGATGFKFHSLPERQAIS